MKRNVGKMEKWKLSRLWKSYKYRFAPWLALNLSNRLVKVSDQHGKSENIASDEDILAELINLLSEFQSPDVRLLYRASEEQQAHFAVVHAENQRRLYSKWGFQV